jgi:hypothetical protein
MAALLAPLLFLSAGAEASPLCDRLFARLADLPRDVSPVEQPRDVSGAVSRQNIELRRARSEQRALGCSGGSIVVVNGANEEACAQIDDRIAALQEDIAVLKAQRNRDIAGSQDDAARRRVMVALQANRCEAHDGDLVNASVSPLDTPDEALDALDAPARRHRNIIADLPPIGSEHELGLRGGEELPAPDLHLLTQDGPLRTLCVRTCDGSFFPISSNATRRDFERDTAACSARCPGAQTALYYHALTEETDDMVSAATGRPYAELPTAFAYKTGSPQTRSQCGCRIPTPAADGGPAPNMSTPALDASAASAAPRGKSVVKIVSAPPRPETLLPSVAPAGEPGQPVEERPYDPKARRVRQVGPAFLPAEESSIDLMHPAGPGYQQQQTN